MRGIVLVAVLVAASVAGCSKGEEPPLREQLLPRLVLHPADLPRPFDRFDEGPHVLADAPRGERADPARFGRSGGWKARYRRAGDRGTVGPLVVESRIDLFEDADGGNRELEAVRRELAAAGARLRRPSSSLGDDSIVALSGEASLPDVVFVTVVWRYRNAIATVSANGFAGRFDAADVIAFARRQQRRLEREASG